MKNIPFDLQVYLNLWKDICLLIDCHYYEEDSCACLYSHTINSSNFNILLLMKSNIAKLNEAISSFQQQRNNCIPIDIETYHIIDSSPQLELDGLKMVRSYISCTRSLNAIATPNLPKDVTYHYAQTSIEICEWLQLEKIDQFFSNKQIIYLQQQLTDPNNKIHLLIIYKNNHPANASLVHIQGKNTYLGFNITHPNFRDHGLGRLSIEIRLQLAKKKDCIQAYLLANSFSLPLAIPLEFKPLSIITNYTLENNKEKQ